MRMQMCSLVLGCSLLVGCTRSDDSITLSRRIESALPEDWSLRRTENELYISKNDPVKALKMFPSMSGMERREPITFTFWITRVDSVSPTQYSELKQHYANLRTEAEYLYRDAKLRQIHELGKVASEFHPRSREEARAVKEYRRLLSEIKPLPDLYLNGCSFMIHQFMYDFEYESERDNCAAAKRQVLSMFKQYDVTSTNSNEAVSDPGPPVGFWL